MLGLQNKFPSQEALTHFASRVSATNIRAEIQKLLDKHEHMVEKYCRYSNADIVICIDLNSRDVEFENLIKEPYTIGLAIREVSNLYQAQISHAETTFQGISTLFNDLIRFKDLYFVQLDNNTKRIRKIYNKADWILRGYLMEYASSPRKYASFPQPFPSLAIYEILNSLDIFKISLDTILIVSDSKHYGRLEELIKNLDIESAQLDANSKICIINPEDLNLLRLMTTDEAYFIKSTEAFVSWVVDKVFGDIPDYFQKQWIKSYQTYKL